MNLLVARLCEAACFAPIAVTINCEEILTELSKLDALKFIRITIPYAMPSVSSPHIRLLALNLLAAAIKNINSANLLTELPLIVNTVIASSSSVLVDIRKAVISVLVECYVVTGDALYPYLSELPMPQKKLLTIYIEKKMKVIYSPVN